MIFIFSKLRNFDPILIEYLYKKMETYVELNFIDRENFG